jgi:SAM-dependent methyltransferase
VNDSRDAPSWYLDPLVAAQKREVHQKWIRASACHLPGGVVLKTDLFEEAHGADRIFDDLLPDMRLAVGMDLNERTALAATRRYFPAFLSIVCDARRLAFRSASLDLVISPSTLDHFESPGDIAVSLDELARVLRPGGVLLISLDNPRNPSYQLLRWLSRKHWTPFVLGRTVSLASLKRMLIERGFRIEESSYLIHNPRGISTVLFLALRKALGNFASGPIRGLLSVFSLLGRLPSRSLTGCFLAVSAIKQGVSKGRADATLCPSLAANVDDEERPTAP